MARQGVGHRLGREPARGLDGAGSPVWPLAVGVVLSAKGFNGRTLAEDRLALALGAYRMGHFLLDLIDVPAWAAADETRGWAPVWYSCYGPMRTPSSSTVVRRPGCRERRRNCGNCRSTF